MFHEYPKAMYRADGLNCVVGSFAEEAALDPHVWFDSPAKAKEGYKPPEKPKLVYDKAKRTIVKTDDSK